jgi:hypothetical protein
VLKTRKKLLAAALALSLALSAFGSTAFASPPQNDGLTSDKGTYDGTTYTPEFDQYITTGGTTVTFRVVPTILYEDTPSGYATAAEADAVEWELVDYAGNDVTITNTAAVQAQNYNAPDGYYASQVTISISSTVGNITIPVRAQTSTRYANFTLTIAGINPVAISGFLPIGPYSNGAGWGSIYSDGTLTTGSTEKFINGYVATGASLGIFGGYIQFDMGEGTPITNDSTNPYGVDFVVYGNVVGSNAEPGSVQVSEDGNNWYELAGSRYYDATTTHVDVITYVKVPEAVPPLFPVAGIYYSLNYTGSVTDPNTTWLSVNTSSSALGFWPDSSEGYDAVYDIDGEVNITGGSPYVVVDRTSQSPYEVITYKNISGISPTGATDRANFQFGYFDVTPNGTSYGTATNPYIPYTSSRGGGDGYDLSWAVDANGSPVALSSVQYIRLYSPVFSPGATIGVNMSPEVCGFYDATPAVSPVGTTTAPDITIDGLTLDELVDEYDIVYNVDTVSNNQQIITISDLGNYQPAFTLQATGGDYVYMNNNLGSTYPVDVSSSAVLVRIINQSGDTEAFVTLIEMTT